MLNKQHSLVQFHFMVPASFTRRTLTKAVVEYLFRKEKKKLDGLSYIFCSDEYLLDINRQYLKHDYYTDIITFDLSDSTRNISGNIYISVDRVKENARTYKTTFQQELLRVIFHGALHLCGYKDKSKKDQEAMRRAEDNYLHYYLSKVKQ